MFVSMSLESNDQSSEDTANPLSAWYHTALEAARQPRPVFSGGLLDVNKESDFEMYLGNLTASQLQEFLNEDEEGDEEEDDDEEDNADDDDDDE